MLNHSRTDIAQYNVQKHARQHSRRRMPSRRLRVIWTLGNLFMLAGAYLIVYVGGLYVQIDYNRQAARGDTDLPAPAAASAGWQTSTSPFNVPILNTTQGSVLSSVPGEAQSEQVSTVSRIVIPDLDVDSKVIEVGWVVEERDGAQVAVWEVAEYAVGQHKGSSNPGEGSNVVLAGHVGGYGMVFRDLFYVEPGDQITLYSEGEQYLYVVQEHLLVDEEGASPEQRAANARYMDPTDEEVVTLITCWPLSGPNRFAQRIIVRATPFVASGTGEGGAWTIR